MIGTICAIVLHCVLLFGTIIVAIVMEDKDYIDDREIYMIVGIFVPLGVLVWLGAVYVGETISARLT